MPGNAGAVMVMCGKATGVTMGIVERGRNFPGNLKYNLEGKLKQKKKVTKNSIVHAERADAGGG
jgi:hypothetical protein